MTRFEPFIEASVNGRPVSADFYTRLNKATITDAPGQSADSCELTFDDADNEIAIPQKGAKLTVKFGFRDDASFKMGVFSVEKSVIDGGEGGEFVILSGRSADMREDIKEPVSEHFDETSIGGMVEELAARHGYGAKVSPEFANLKLPYMARVNQSASDFLTRVADRNDAVFSIKDNKFLFLKRGLLPAITINKSQCISWNFTVEPRPRYGKAEAGWFDRKTGETKFTSASTGLEGPINRLRTTFPTQGEAEAAAQSESGRANRATGSGSLEFSGMPEMMADTPIITQGWRKEANGLWRAATVTHTYGETYTTGVELEAPEDGKS